MVDVYSYTTVLFILWKPQEEINRYFPVAIHQCFFLFFVCVCPKYGMLNDGIHYSQKYLGLFVIPSVRAPAITLLQGKSAKKRLVTMATQAKQGIHKQLLKITPKHSQPNKGHPFSRTFRSESECAAHESAGRLCAIIG